MRTFFYISLPFFLSGLFLIARFFYFQFFTEHIGVGRHVQSLVIGGTLVTLGLLVFIFGVLADLIAANRRLTEEALYRLRKLELTAQDPAIEIERVNETQKSGDSQLGDS